MISQRLKAITKLIDKDDKVVDVGCDHGLLSIYLYQNKLCKKVIASDVNKNALQNAIKNIEKNKLSIKTYLSNGIQDVPLDNINTIIISGMGTSNILKILDDKEKLKKIEKIVLQSNNEYEILRKKMNGYGYYLFDEIITYENKKYYITMLFKKDNRNNSKKEIKYGIIKKENKDYYNYLIIKYKHILKKLPYKEVIKRWQLILKIKYLKRFS